MAGAAVQGSPFFGETTHLLGPIRRHGRETGVLQGQLVPSTSQNSCPLEGLASSACSPVRTGVGGRGHHYLSDRLLLFRKGLLPTDLKYRSWKHPQGSWESLVRGPALSGHPAPLGHLLKPKMPPPTLSPPKAGSL